MSRSKIEKAEKRRAGRIRDWRDLKGAKIETEAKQIRFVIA
jgi:hypothetical protein